MNDCNSISRRTRRFIFFAPPNPVILSWNAMYARRQAVERAVYADGDYEGLVFRLIFFPQIPVLTAKQVAKQWICSQVGKQWNAMYADGFIQTTGGLCCTLDPPSLTGEPSLSGERTPPHDFDRMRAAPHRSHAES